MKTITNIILIACTLFFSGCRRNEKSGKPGGMHDTSASDVSSGGPMLRIVAVSPALASDDKTGARAQVTAEHGWICTKAPAGAETQIWDALSAKPVASFKAVPGAARVRIKANARALAAASAFFSKEPPPRTPEDGRVNLPRFAQSLAQKRFPANTAVVVLGNPLFISNGTDAVYNMNTGYVPTDGNFAEPTRTNLFSTLGRAKALSGQHWYMAWSTDPFIDDSHRVGVEAFWAKWLKQQSATLVHFGNSMPAAVASMRDGESDAISSEEIDASAKPGMRKVVITPAHESDAVETSTDKSEIAPKRETEAPPLKPGKKTVKEVAKDKHGNPLDADLIDKGEASGQRLLWLTTSADRNLNESPLIGVLREKGFIVRVMTAPLPPAAELAAALREHDQLWLFSSGEKAGLQKAHADAVAEAWRAGLDVCLLADNAPLFLDANPILDRIAKGASFSGDWRADKIIGPRTGSRGGGFDKASPVFHGIEQFWEGYTVATITCAGKLTPICWHTGGKPLIAVRDSAGKEGRLALHGGFTQFFAARMNEKAGTERVGVNLAGWLAGKSE